MFGVRRLLMIKTVLMNNDLAMQTAAFLLHDATQSAVICHRLVIRASVTAYVCPSVCDVQVCFSHRLKYFENNFTADYT